LALLKPFQLAIISDIISAYKYDQPFHHYFAGLAKQHRNWGSKDRKLYRNVSYAYFRFGFMTLNQSIPDMVQMAFDHLQEGTETQFDPKAFFPYQEFVSSQIDFETWTASHLKQKPVYLVAQLQAKQTCIDFFEAQNIPFEALDNNCFKLPADSKCDELTDNGKAWMMDIASSRATELIDIKQYEQVWDACSGAGGKSLYLTQKYDNSIDLTCSDKRFTILENLKQRFIKLGFRLPKVELIDLMEPSHVSDKYDVIILDVPCSGSGTWGRTPEQIRTFTEMTPENYARIQRKIVANALKNLAANGRLYYLTCSVFGKENEENVKHFEINHHLKCLREQYVHGNFELTDTLYFAELIKDESK